MENISVELILFIVLGSVFIVDFALKGLKKSSKKKEGITSFNESSANNTSDSSNKYLQYFIERPRNITLFIFITLLAKVLLHYSIYPQYLTPRIFTKNLRKSIIGEDITIINCIKNLFIYDYESPSEFIFMWLISVSLISFIVWQLNPYIKKR